MRLIRRNRPNTEAEDETTMPRSPRAARRVLRGPIAVATTLFLGAGLLTATPAAAGSWPADMTCVPGTYRIHTGAGMVLTANEDDINHGMIIQWPYDGHPSQRWRVCYKILDQFYNKEFEFISAIGGGPWCMGAADGWPNEGYVLKAQDCSNLSHQRFTKILSQATPGPGQGELFSLQLKHNKMFVAIKDYTVIHASAAQYPDRADLFWYDLA
ncbi:RICIN domain-containing protein [Embleya sp. AB8]|uniref:RICIN domain-containing protein n=1 Tax=Embleya sp. AB8 TaxID=3156304 RepID=UPI003C77589B